MRSFEYDDDGKLLRAVEDEEQQGQYIYTYQYDDMGNRTFYSKTRDGEVQESAEYTYNVSNQLVSAKIYDGKKNTTIDYTYDADGNLIAQDGKIGTDKVELTYIYTVENRLKAVYDADEFLVAMAYDGDGNRIFQLNYNLHTDDDWKGNSGNGNGNNKDNAGSGSSTVTGTETASEDTGIVAAVVEFFTGEDETEATTETAETSETEAATETDNGAVNGNKDKDKGNNGNDKNNGVGNGNGKSSDDSDTGSDSSTDTETDSSTEDSGTASGNTTNTEGSTNQSSILFPIEDEVSELEQELIDMIKTEGKEKNYELIEYMNDVNREYAEVLMELNINGIMDTAYTYGNERLTNERFTGWTGYYTYDPRGSVSGITDSEGMIWQSYRYDGYGNITFGKPEYNNVYAYNAESYNPNIDVQYLRARYYCPTTADFLTKDTYLGDISDPLTLNRYSYVKSSPLNYVDPSGHTVEDLIKQVKSTAFELNRNWNKAVHQGTKAFDSWFSNSMESIMNTARDACRTLDCEIADVTYSFGVGLIYSAVDNLIFQSGNALLELVGINSAYDSARFREDMENWMLENAVPDELGFFAGQVVGDAFMTAEMLVKLPQILETIAKNLANLTTTSSVVGYQLNPDGTVVAIEGMGFSLAEAGVLVEEFGTAGALVAASFMSATGIGNDSGKFVEALTDGDSYSYKNGIYDKADYHSGQTTGRKNPAPKDGQFALDNSVSIGENTTRRIGLDSNGDFVVFDETSSGVFHGHTRTWKAEGGNQGLTQEMKNALYDAGFIKSPTGSKFKLTDYAKSLIRN